MDKSRRKKRWIAAGLIAAVLIFSVVIWKFVGTPMVNFISDPAAFRVWVEANGWRARLIFAGMVIFQVVIAAIPGALVFHGAHNKHEAMFVRLDG